MFSAEMSVSLIYLCSGRWVPGKQRAQRIWESLSDPCALAGAVLPTAPAAEPWGKG